MHQVHHADQMLQATSLYPKMQYARQYGRTMDFAPPQRGLPRFEPSLFPRRLDLEIHPEVYERLQEISIRSGRSIPEIVQELISRSFPDPPQSDP